MHGAKRNNPPNGKPGFPLSPIRALPFRDRDTAPIRRTREIEFYSIKTRAPAAGGAAEDASAGLPRVWRSLAFGGIEGGLPVDDLGRPQQKVTVGIRRYRVSESV